MPTDAAPLPTATIVVPTYREAENLEILLPRVAGVLSEAGVAYEILVVDDDSGDGTVEVCARFADEMPVRLIVRTDERGLSSAVMEGFRQARGELLVVMDADLSHPPETLPAMLRVLQDGRGDFVIGSRYIDGGSTDAGWGFFRWLNSKAATLLARPLTAAKDPMAGFIALPRAAFEQADALNPIGYKIGLELIVKCDRKAVVEVPIHFQDRTLGESKLNMREQWNYVRHLMRLYAYKLKR